MNNYSKIINNDINELAKFLAVYQLCNICEYQATTLCQSISHKKESCIIGIKRFLEKEMQLKNE